MKRYPGLKPFTEKEQNIFFGRTEDREKLLQKIKLEQIVVLYSKSGLGKSSLLNAGVIPEMEAQQLAIPLKIRLGSYTEGDKNQPTPIVKLIEELNVATNHNQPFVLDRLIANENSLWYNLKRLQVQQRDNRLPYILFFDQFEELFTYPQAQVAEFCEQLATILRVAVPANFAKRLQEILRTDRNAIARDDFAFINKALHVKVVFAIRSDRMSLLNAMTAYIPDVLHNCFELKPLSVAQAQDAVMLPAQLVAPEFTTPVFGYETDALRKIIDALKDDKQNIESFQLQIICQYCENLISSIPDASLSNRTNEGLQKTSNGPIGHSSVMPLTITANHIGDIRNILETFYTQLIDNLHYTDPAQKQTVYRVLGEDFIFEREQRRILVYEGIVLQRLGSDLLKQLTASFILRSEKNSTGGFVYELSHDTLVAPILKAFTALREIEELRIKNEALRIEREKAERERRRQRTIIAIVSIAAVVSVAFGIFGFVNMRKAQAEEQKAKTALEQFVIADRERKQAQVKELIQKARSFVSFDEKQVAIDKLHEALKIDSTNRDVIIELKKLNP